MFKCDVCKMKYPEGNHHDIWVGAQYYNYDGDQEKHHCGDSDDEEYYQVCDVCWKDGWILKHLKRAVEDVFQIFTAFPKTDHGDPLKQVMDREIAANKERE
jgi:hypothetical protein